MQVDIETEHIFDYIFEQGFCNHTRLIKFVLTEPSLPAGLVHGFCNLQAMVSVIIL